VFVKLAGKGIEVYESIIEIKYKVIEKIFGILTEEERRTMIGIMKKLNNEFNEFFLEGII
jgi:DNA-binding MarR family transcriptional regulator